MTGQLLPRARRGPTLGPRETARMRAVTTAVVAAVSVIWLISHAGTLLYPVEIGELALEGDNQLGSQEKTVEIVVARYNDNLSWLPPIVEELDATVTVYCKNREAKEPIVPCTEYLDNVGNEGHTYLLHITRRYRTGLKRLTVFIPDTSEYGDKLKTWRRFKRNLDTYGKDIFYADDFTPITVWRYSLGFLNMVFYGPNFPCKDTRQGGEQCQYFGHTGGANDEGYLAPATPPVFSDWLWQHLHSTQLHIARCGWGNRGMFAASRAAVHKHPPELYERLLGELSRDAFPMAGMFMERLWRRVFLCSEGGDLYVPGAPHHAVSIRSAAAAAGGTGVGVSRGFVGVNATTATAAARRHLQGPQQRQELHLE